MCDDCMAEAEAAETQRGADFPALTRFQGKLVCKQCGLEVAPEFESLPNGTRGGSMGRPRGATSQYGTEQRSPNQSMLTFIERGRRNSGNKRGAAAESLERLLRRQHKWGAGSKNYGERNRDHVSRLIEQACSSLGISPDVRNTAKTLFEDTNSLARTRADGRTGLIAACVLVAARQARVPRSPKELTAVFDTTAACITKGAKLIYTTLHHGCDEAVVDGDGRPRASSPTGVLTVAVTATKRRITMTTPAMANTHELDRRVYVCGAVDFVPRFYSKAKIGIDLRAAAIARNIARLAEEHQIVSTFTPQSVAGGVVMYVTKLCMLPAPVPKDVRKRIAEVSGVSEVTIQKVKARLDLFRSHLLRKEDVDKLIHIRNSSSTTATRRRTSATT